MIAVEPFQPGDLSEIVVQPAQAGALPPEARAAFAQQAWAMGPAWSARAQDGRLILCAGLLEVHPGWATAWCVMAEGKGAALLAITRRIRLLMEEAPWARIDLLTHATFEAAAVWAGLLGFRQEGVRRASLPCGGDEIVWVRIRGET